MGAGQSVSAVGLRWAHVAVRVLSLRVCMKDCGWARIPFLQLWAVHFQARGGRM